jgi:zinc protease
MNGKSKIKSQKAKSKSRRKLFFKRLFVFTFAFCLLPFDFLLATPPALPAFPPLKFHPPKPERIVMPNGLIIFLLEDHELPLIKLSITTRAGSLYEPADKVGLSNIFGPVMTDGGGEHYSPEQIRRALDVTGGSIGFSAGTESATGSLQCRAADFDKVFPMFTDLLLHPLFRGDYFNLEKDKAQEALRRMNDEPGDVARREFRKAVYGGAHPYARTPTPESIDRIKRKDLQAMHAAYFKPNVSMIALSGDFQSAAMKEKLTAALSGWAKATVVYPKVPVVRPPTEKALYYAQFPIDQSQIRIGRTGLARHDPDHFAFEIFNELWGGSATSRLFQIVRTQKGLAYQVASVFTEPADLGLMVVICQTRGPETLQAVRSIQEINQNIQTAPFTDGEIQFAKESIRNRFVENFTSSAQITEEILSMEFNGYPADYLDTYTDQVARVTRADLERVGKRLIQPDSWVTLIVGDLSTFDKPLSTIGRPREIRIPDYRAP